MFTERSSSRRSGADKRAGWWACRPAMMVLLLGLAACNPIDTWRDWTGASRNDPDPETTPNTQNLAAGGAADYPNLATVPPPPVRAMTAAEREKLTQSLIADRANARYSDEQLRAGFSTAAAPPPPPGSASASEPESAQASPAVPAPPPAPTTTLPPSPPPAAPAAPPPSAAAVASAAGDKLTALPPAATSGAAQAGQKTAAGSATALRKQGEPPEPAPMESSLELPQARATPQPEQFQAAPSPPQLPPPKVASTAASLPGGLAAGGALAPTPLPEAKAAAGFEPAPPTPEVPPPPAARSAAAETGNGAQKPPAPVGAPVAEIKFARDGTNLSEGDRQTLETVVPLFQQNPGKIRVIGYAAGGNGAVEQLNSYRTALDRAQAVSAALAQAGIPADKIQVEAAPAAASSGEARAEVILEH